MHTVLDGKSGQFSNKKQFRRELMPSTNEANKQLLIQVYFIGPRVTERVLFSSMGTWGSLPPASIELRTTT